MDVLENKNAPGNGLTDVVSPEEVEPLKKKSGYREEMMDIGPDGEDDDRGGRRHSRKMSLSSGSSSAGVVQNLAYKLKLGTRRALILLTAAVLLILLFFIIIIVLAASWPTDLSQSTCNTPQCHLFSAKILAGLNESSQPCQDFWEFGCGGWLGKNPIPKSKASWSSEQQEQYKLKEKMRNMINRMEYTDDLSSVDSKVNLFYQMCMALEYVEQEGEKPLKRVIQQLGGWQVFHTFKPAGFDFPRILTKLQGEWRVSPFFHIEIISDPRGPARNLIKISPAGLSLPDRSYYFRTEDPIPTAFRTFVKDVIQLLGSPSNQAEQMATEIFSFEKRIAEITPDPLELRDPVQSLNKISVGQLRSQSSTIFWADLLRALFPQANVNDMTEVVVTSEQYLVDISSIISTTDKGNLNNYLMWHFTQKYLHYLSKPFQQVYEIYRRQTTGSTEPFPRWEFCMDETMKFFPHALNAMLAKDCEDRGNKSLKMEAMFEAMRTTLRDRFENGLKYNETMKNFAIDKLRLMGIQVGTPLRNKTILNDLYYSLSLQKFDFFINIQYATDYQLNQMRLQLANPTRESRILATIARSPYKISYVPSLNKVVVPESVLQKNVLLLENNFLPILYGSVGVELGEAIASAYGIQDGLFFANGVLMTDRDPKVQETRNLVEAKRRCLASFFIQIKLDDEPYIERTSLDTTIHLGGIQIAYDTLKEQADREILGYLPSLQRLNPFSVFFISYVQSQCAAQTILYHHDIEHSTFTSLSNDYRTKGLLRQFVPFTEAMNCGTRSEMYADFSCGYVI